MITFRVPAVPVPQPRQRHRIASSRGGKSFVQNYTPAKDPVNAFKATVRMAAMQALDGPPMEGMLIVHIVAVFPRRSNHVWKSKPMPRVRYVGSKDWDNIAKSVCDALNGTLWVDDKQVVVGTVEKWEASGDEQAHVVVTVTEIDEQPKPRKVTDLKPMPRDYDPDEYDEVTD